MKKLMLIGLFSFIAVGLFAQKTSLGTAKSASTEKSDPQAESILGKVNTKYASYKSMKMDLKVTIQDGKFKEEQTAKVSVKGNKFKIDSKDQLIISDGKKNWIYLKEDGQLQISQPDPDDVGMFASPDKLLKMYQDEFISGYIGKFKLNGKVVHKIEFKPKDKNSEYSKVAVYIDVNSLNVAKIKVFDKSNIHYSIEMKNFVKNTDMKDSDFKFDEKTVSEENIIRLCDNC